MRRPSDRPARARWAHACRTRVAVGALALVAVACGGASPTAPSAAPTARSSVAAAPTGVAAPTAATNQAWHRDVVATVFWIGEGASRDNGGIANAASAWDEDWMAHYGGVDDPRERAGLGPRFSPRENPFYVALPYNDFDDEGERRPDAASVVPWAGSTAWPDDRSMVKNRWLEVRNGDRVVFAQWEDVGPFLEDDAAYVFGSARPRNEIDARAGIDLSPAVRDALDVGDVSTVDWRFVDERDVPAGPWTAVVTTSQLNWR